MKPVVSAALTVLTLPLASSADLDLPVANGLVTPRVGCRVDPLAAANRSLCEVSTEPSRRGFQYLPSAKDTQTAVAASPPSLNMTTGSARAMLKNP